MTVGTISKRRRRTAPAPAKPTASSRGWIWAVAQIAILGAEVFATLFLMAQPAFRPKQVEVTGTTHLTPAQIIAALSLPADRNIFFLNHNELEQRLTAQIGSLPAHESRIPGIDIDTPATADHHEHQQNECRGVHVPAEVECAVQQRNAKRRNPQVDVGR